MAIIIITITAFISLMIQFYLPINVDNLTVVLLAFINFRTNQSTFRGVIVTFDQETVEQNGTKWIHSIETI